MTKYETIHWVLETYSKEDRKTQYEIVIDTLDIDWDSDEGLKVGVIFDGMTKMEDGINDYIRKVFL